MATAVFFHAHPDDETLFTGGTMARAKPRAPGRPGDRHPGANSESTAPVPCATRAWPGHREAAAGAARRRGCASRSWAARTRSRRPGGGQLCQAPAEEAALRLAAIVTEEAAETLVTYDARGIYGHPDHLQVHKVGLRAAQLADLATVYLATIDKAWLQSLLQMAETFGLSIDDQTIEMGSHRRRLRRPDHDHGRRRRLHRRQAGGTGGAATVSPGDGATPASAVRLRMVFGTEWYIELRSVGAACVAGTPKSRKPHIDE